MNERWMSQEWRGDIPGMLSQIGVAELFDILLVAAFFYGLLAWTKASRSRAVFLGCAALGVVYLLARLFDLELTLSVFQTGTTVLLVVLVVIFQEEVKRSFERIASASGLSSRHISPASVGINDVLVEACVHLEKQRIGALIVLPGRDPLDRHTTGGVNLDGEMTEPLLYSIFDTHSLGHDGAVIVAGDRVAKFGVHLPLSKNVGGREKFGTRHTAALGLSEQTDALVLVVSEERGEVSVARNGKLKHVESSDLKAILDEFSGATAERRTEGIWSKLLLRDPLTKAASFLLAAAFWMVFVGHQRETIARTFTVPIVVTNVPDDWTLEDPKPHEARVTLTGSSRAVRLLDPGQLSISLDASEPRSGLQAFPLGVDDVSHPSEVTPEHIDTDVVRVRAYPTTSVELPVALKTKGKISPGVHLGEMTPNPKKVSVRIRKQDVGALKSIETEPVDLTGIEKTSEMQARLRFPKHVRPGVDTPEFVNVRIEAEKPKTETR